MMATFTVRVELHGATSKDYDKLHKAMESKGFSRTISSSQGTTYQLPTGEYSFEGSSTRKQVLALAKSAAATTKLKYAVLVTESNGRTWDYLQAVA
jgi:hypothetical protein